MVKNFDGWNEIKKNIHGTDKTIFFHEREVWWCSLGVNVGFEQDGKGSDFGRPVIILKVYSTNACLVVPLTTRPKKGHFYFLVGLVDGENATAILSQVRFVDKRRLVNKMDVVNVDVFLQLRNAIVEVNLK